MTKILFDGTEVEDGVPTYTIKDGHHLLKPEDEAQALIDRAASEASALVNYEKDIRSQIYNQKESMYVHGDKILICNIREKNMLTIDPNCGITCTHTDAVVLAASAYNGSIMVKCAEVTDNSTIAELEQIMRDLQTIESNKTF